MDHCETPTVAYEDIRPLMCALAKSLGKTPAQLRVYDPYFCAGTVCDRLRSLGFANVINRNRDFYADIKSGSTPDYDVLVSNPPFSASHMPKALRYCRASGKPWMLLMPNYVCLKPFYKRALASGAADLYAREPTMRTALPLLFAPPDRYTFDRRAENEAQNSPNICLWYVSGGITLPNSSMLQWWNREGRQAGRGGCTLVAQPKQLPTAALADTNWLAPSRRRR